MISYFVNAAWGDTVPDTELVKALRSMGVELKVEQRKDKLFNIEINIDEDRVLQNKKKTPSKKKPVASPKKSVKTATEKNGTKE